MGVTIFSIHVGGSYLDGATHIVGIDEEGGDRGVHVVVIGGHAARVDDDAERDEQVDERVHDEELDVVRELVPARAALPAPEVVRQRVFEPLGARRAAVADKT